MAITLVTTASGSGNTTTSVDIVCPTVEDGDIIVATVVNGGAAAYGTGPTGFTRHTSGSEVGTALSGAIWWKRADGTEDGTTLTWSGMTDSCAACLDVYRGALAAGDPFEVITAELNAASSDVHTAITTLTDGAWVGFSMAVNDNVSPTSVVCTDPTLVARGSHVSAGGLDSAAKSYSAEKATAGTTGDFTWVIAVANVTVAFSLKPLAVVAQAPRRTLLGVG